MRFLSMKVLFLKIRRRETPFYQFLYDLAKSIQKCNMPDFFIPFYRVLSVVHHGAIASWRRLCTFFYYEPIFRSKCKRVGVKLTYVKLRQGLPYFHGNIEIFLGDNVTVHSRSSFSAASIFDCPSLYVGDNTYLGPGLSIGVAKQIAIGRACLIASNVSITDNDGHPFEADKRERDEPVSKENVRPVSIGDNVWIGQGATILKGVTIGNRSIVGAMSVVKKDVPPDTVASGNPAVALKYHGIT